MKPLLDVQLDGSRTVGSPLKVVAVLRPASAGSVQVKIDGQLSTLVPTRQPAHGAHRRLDEAEAELGGRVARRRRAHPRAEPRRTASTGPGVVALERRLRELHYAVRDTDGVFDDDDQGAVLAFQKVNGLERTGVVTPRSGRCSRDAGVPQARYGGDHVEVDKTRQVLFLVRDGKVVLTTHVSTGATGNTPLGAVARLRASGRAGTGCSGTRATSCAASRSTATRTVPAYPASHGCVRVPMWLATSALRADPDGQRDLHLRLTPRARGARPTRRPLPRRRPRRSPPPRRGRGSA